MGCIVLHISSLIFYVDNGELLIGKLIIFIDQPSVSCSGELTINDLVINTVVRWMSQIVGSVSFSTESVGTDVSVNQFPGMFLIIAQFIKFFCPLLWFVYEQKDIV